MSAVVAMILAALWLAAATGAGATLIRAIGVWPTGKLERTLLALGLGFPLAAYLMFAAGTAGWLVPATAWTILPLLAVVCLPVWRRPQAEPDPSTAQPGSPASQGFERRLVVVVAALVGLGAAFNLVGALAPPTEWDSLTYHLAAPAYFIRQGQISFVPYRNWPDPFTAEMWNLLGLLMGSDRFPQVVSWAMGLAGAGALYVLAGRRTTPKVGILAAAMFYAAPQVTMLSTSAKSDLTWLLFVFLSLHTLLRWSEEHDRRWFWLSAMFTGLAMATKVHGLFWAASIGGLLMIIPGRRWIREPGRLVVEVIGYGLLAAAVVMPWWVRNWLAGRDPIWPYAFPWLHSEYWSIRCHQKYSAFVQGPGNSVVHFVLGLWNLTVNQSGWQFLLRTPTTPLVLAFAPAAAAGWPRFPQLSRRVLGLAAIAALVYYTLWFATYQLPRYLMPALSLLVIPAAYAFWWMADRPRLRWAATALLVSGLAFGVAYAAAFNVRLAPVVLGLQTEPRFLANNASFYEDFQWVDAHLPADARVLVFQMKTYYLRRDFLRGDPNVWPVTDQTTAAELLRLLRQRGVTHVFVTGADREPNASESAPLHRLLDDLRSSGYLRRIYYNPAGRLIESRGLARWRPVSVEVWELRGDPLR